MFFGFRTARDGRGAEKTGAGLLGDGKAGQTGRPARCPSCPARGPSRWRAARSGRRSPQFFVRRRVDGESAVNSRQTIRRIETFRASNAALTRSVNGVDLLPLRFHMHVSLRNLIVIHVDTLELQVRVAVVRARRVNAVLVADHLPELRADLVAALAALDVPSRNTSRKETRPITKCASTKTFRVKNPLRSVTNARLRG